MEKKKDLINLIFSPKLLIIEWSVIIVFCIFIGFSIRSQAAETNNGLPYNVNNELPLDYSTFVETYNNTWQTYPVYWDNENVIAYLHDYVDDNNYWIDFIVPYVEEPTYTLNLNGVPYESFDINNNYVTISFNSNQWYHLNFRVRNGSLSAYGFSNTLNLAFLGTNAKPIFLNGGSYNWGDYPVIYVYSGDFTVTGHATPPDLTGDNIGSDKPDIDDYLPNIPNIPSLDNSSLEKIAESIFNILQWGFNAIKGILQGLFEYLADTFTYSIQKVIDNIKNAIQNFYDNMKSLFEPLLNGLAEIAQGIKQTIENIGLLLEAFFAPFDEEQFKEAYQNCDFINAVDGVNDSIEEFEHAFTYAEERDHYTLYLGFMMDGYTVNYDLDFTWLYPLRQYYRPIIWAVVIYEFFVYLCSQLSDYLQGRSGK